MKNALRSLALLFALLPAVASAQLPNIQDKAVWGRIGSPGNDGGSGPSTAIPFATLAVQLSPLIATNPLGVDANVLNAISTTYSIATTDCGKTIYSTGALYTISLPAVSGFAATCSVLVKEGSGTRGKVLAGAGLPSDLLSNILWPNQSIGFKIDNGVWTTFYNPGKWNLTATLNVYVDHTNGSDTNNDCLTTTTGACATIQNAYNVIKASFNCGNYQATIQNANETFTESNVIVYGPSCDGVHPDTIIQGNSATPGNVVWQVSGNGSNGIAVLDHGLAIINGFKFVGLGTGQTAIVAENLGFATFLNVEFGTFASGIHLQGLANGIIGFEGGGTYTVSGNATYHLKLDTGASTHFNGVAVSVPNALTFSQWAAAVDGSKADLSLLTFTGTGSGAGSTGSKYIVGSNSTLILSGATLPGASAGTTTLNGCTDAGCAAVPLATISGLGTGVATALGNNIGASGGILALGGALNTSPKTYADINANTSSSPALIVSTSVARLQAVDTTSGGLEMATYTSTAAQGNIIAGGVAAGTSASPSPTGTGPISQYMFNMRGYGYNAGWQLGGIWIIDNSEVWASGHQGTQQQWFTTPNGSTTIAQAMQLNASGGLYVGGVTDPTIGKVGALNGFMSGTTAGVSCSGTPTSSFVSVGGIVTHC